MFAGGLALILPEHVPHQNHPNGSNLTPEILSHARSGHYAQCGWGTDKSWPYYFCAKEYCGHLLPTVKELWRACYIDVGLAHTIDTFTALLDMGQPTETTT